MKKKIFGIKVSTILTAFICFIVSIVIWMLVKYNIEMSNAESAIAFFGIMHS